MNYLLSDFDVDVQQWHIAQSGASDAPQDNPKANPISCIEIVKNTKKGAQAEHKMQSGRLWKEWNCKLSGPDYSTVPKRLSIALFRSTDIAVAWILTSSATWQPFIPAIGVADFTYNIGKRWLATGHAAMIQWVG